MGRLASESGLAAVTELAADIDAGALDVYAANHRPRGRSGASVDSMVDFSVLGVGERAEFGDEPRPADGHDLPRAPDLVVAGPPCQGHSNLNNHSRRDDPRNLLYLAVPAFAVAVGAKAVIIENVPGVVHDRRARVVESARSLLQSAGYAVTAGVLAADAMGWPQTRKRFFLVARRRTAGPPIPLGEAAAALADGNGARSVLWAIGGGQARTGDALMDDPPNLSEATRRRIKWLVDHKAYDLPLSERPACHRHGTTYLSVYGRMRGDQPAGTITPGFMVQGQGRFVHPTLPRTLTPAEAARLQGFPKTYDFIPDPDRPPPRARLAAWIGNAVPMPLGYAAALAALGPDLPRRPVLERLDAIQARIDKQGDPG